MVTVRRWLKRTSVTYICSRIGDAVRCGACDRGLLPRARRGARCRVCGATIEAIMIADGA